MMTTARNAIKQMEQADDPNEPILLLCIERWGADDNRSNKCTPEQWAEICKVIEYESALVLDAIKTFDAVVDDVMLHGRVAGRFLGPDERQGQSRAK